MVNQKPVTLSNVGGEKRLSTRKAETILRQLIGQLSGESNLLHWLG